MPLRPESLIPILHRVPTSLLLFTICAFASATPSSERLYLSGKSKDDPIDWQFKVSAGRKADRWTTIPVPSQWELQGFGAYNYGHDQVRNDLPRLNEEGYYKLKFTVPKEWRDQAIKLVFEGVMTDAEVTLNGRPLGSHQGAFYEFSFPVEKLLKFEPTGSNLLEVKVAKHSANQSVNRAERHADYWIFGGIFRPVYLQAAPPNHIERVAANAQADGSLAVSPRLFA